MQRAGYQLQLQRSDRMKGGVMVTQFEIYEGMLNHAVESLLGKIRTNLDISMQVLEAARKILPYEREQFIQFLQELEKRMDGAPKS